MSNISKNLQKVRKKKDLSQGNICRVLDLDRAYISNVENGKQKITISTMEKIAKALNVKIDQLLK